MDDTSIAVSADLKGRVVLITGAASGIGRATALLAGYRGAAVAVVDINGDAARQVADEVLAQGSPATVGLECDVADADAVDRTFEKATATLGSVDALLANAGMLIPGRVNDISVEDWDRQIAVNLRGVFLCCRRAIIDMIAQGEGGSIVCTSSPNGEASLPEIPAYAASKGGISALVRALAVDHAVDRIRVNAISPGATETGMMWDGVDPSDVERLRGVLNAEIPLGRIADPIEPARAAVWLLSNEAAYVTGSHIHIDGGISARASLSA